MTIKFNPKEKLEVRDVKDISSVEKASIMYFLQGAVYCWCKNRPKEWFSMRDLMGGENFYWEGTPLFALYQKHIDKRKDHIQSIEWAGKDSGWLLKRIISDDKREFKTKEEDRIRKYQWTGKE
ncbi:hypothetical protein L3073_04435 [Ancylomarina sp. DW003]|nr:hypothetical protein [Ancylomarina sp. DW003]MDE5421448.1 hypothetical protein [Ancylomarina sp. DW003]